jgi:hypothetical protein
MTVHIKGIYVHPMDGPLILIAIRRAHQERSGRDQNHIPGARPGRRREYDKQDEDDEYFFHD